MADAGNAAAVVETTSHGLAADRVRGIAYDVAILTNLTHEHLEFHGSWEAYRDAKLSLFERLAAGPTNPPKQLDGRDWPKAAIVNADDPTAGAFIGVAQEAGARIADLRHGSGGRRPGRPASRRTRSGLRIALRRAAAATAELSLRLVGPVQRPQRARRRSRSARSSASIPPRSVPASRRSRGVPGRMERLDAGQPFGVVDRLRPQPGVAREGPRAPRARWRRPAAAG